MLTRLGPWNSYHLSSRWQCLNVVFFRVVFITGATDSSWSCWCHWASCCIRWRRRWGKRGIILVHHQDQVVHLSPPVWCRVFCLTELRNISSKQKLCIWRTNQQLTSEGCWTTGFHLSEKGGRLLAVFGPECRSSSGVTSRHRATELGGFLSGRPGCGSVGGLGRRPQYEQCDNKNSKNRTMNNGASR